jgi:protein-arginine kinase activator protein McsA
MDKFQEVENILNELNPKPQQQQQEEDKCKDCGSPLEDLPDDGLIVCKNCGMINEHYLVATHKFEKNSKNPAYTYNHKCCYKQINHLSEILNKIQGRSVPEIPKKVFDTIKKQINNKKIKLKHLSYSDLRDILKELGYQKYYDHIPYIHNVITSKTPPKIFFRHEEKIKAMFLQIQIPFHKYCPKERKNFLRYSYILYKICELLQYKQYYHLFPILKSKSKIIQHDQIWKKICHDLGWPFYPTI